MENLGPWKPLENETSEEFSTRLDEISKQLSRIMKEYGKAAGKTLNILISTIHRRGIDE